MLTLELTHIITYTQIENALEELQDLLDDEIEKYEFDYAMEEMQILEKMLEEGADEFMTEEIRDEQIRASWEDQIPNNLRPYIDWEKLIADESQNYTAWELDGDITYYS